MNTEDKMQVKFIYIFIVLIIILVVGCGDRQITKSPDEELSIKTVKSKYSDLQFDIPGDWIEIEKESTKFFDICVVDKFYTKAVYLIPIILDEETELLLGQNRLEQIAHYSILMKSAEYGVNIDKNSLLNFNIGKKEFILYEFLTQNNNKIVVAVFEHPSGPQEITFGWNDHLQAKNKEFNTEKIQRLILSSLK